MDGPISLKATGRGRRRLLVNKLAELGAFSAALVAIVVLGILVWSVFSRGVHALNLNFFTKGPSFFDPASGGVAPALVGSLLLVGIATVMALPIGVLTAIFVSEFAPRRLGEPVDEQATPSAPGRLQRDRSIHQSAPVRWKSKRLTMR